MAGETAEMKNALKSAERGGRVEVIEGMAVISCAASELINTGNYSNVTVGPISVTRMVKDDDALKEEIQRTQSLCEDAVAEERQTIQALLRGNAAKQA